GEERDADEQREEAWPDAGVAGEDAQRQRAVEEEAAQPDDPQGDREVAPGDRAARRAWFHEVTRRGRWPGGPPSRARPLPAGTPRTRRRTCRPRSSRTARAAPARRRWRRAGRRAARAGRAPRPRGSAAPPRRASSRARGRRPARAAWARRCRARAPAR